MTKGGDMKTDTLQEGWLICFTKEGEIWVYIDSMKDLEAWAKINGFTSMEELEQESWFSVDKIIGNAVCFFKGSIEFAKDRDWWPTIDIEELRAAAKKIEQGEIDEDGNVVFTSK